MGYYTLVEKKTDEIVSGSSFCIARGVYVKMSHGILEITKVIAALLSTIATCSFLKSLVYLSM